MARRRFPFGTLARGVALGGLALLFVFAGLVALYTVAPPFSTLMLGRTIEGKRYERIYVRLADIAPVAVASVIASEDDGFCQNDGVDWGALHEVLSGAGKNGPKRGASTITMQTAKNLFCGQVARPFARELRSASRSFSARFGRRRTPWKFISTSPNGATGSSGSRRPRNTTSTRGRVARRARVGAAGDFAAEPDQARRCASEAHSAHSRRPHRRAGPRRRRTAELLAAINSQQTAPHLSSPPIIIYLISTNSSDAVARAFAAEAGFLDAAERARPRSR